MWEKENAIWVIFILGSALLFWKFYKSQESNFYALSIFLIAILILILFKDKLEEFSISGEGLKMKLRKLKLSQDKEKWSQEKSILTLKKFKGKDISGVEK